MMSDKIDVFIINDDTQTLRYLQAVINKVDGMRSIGSTTRAEAAADIVATIQPDVVLIDYSMSPITGVDLMRAIHHELPELPIILISSIRDQAEDALEAGAIDFLRTPITPRLLIDAIQKAHDSIDINDNPLPPPLPRP
jgi:two-component SAPR family response regulator